MASAKTIVLITGATSGVGLATAAHLARASAGYHVLVAGRTLSKSQQAISSVESSTANNQPLKGTLSPLELEVTSESSISAAASAVQKTHGRLDILINNAGVGGFESQSLPDKIRACFEANALGAVMVTEAFQPLLLKSDNARIIFVSSGQGSVNRKLDPTSPTRSLKGLHYRMSKAAMNMAMAEYQVDLEDKGVKVYAMCPGYVHSNIRREKEAAPGALSADTSAETLVGIINGERDGEMGKLLHRDGVYDW